MVIKSFLGETVAAALKEIRSDLGPKAMVLKTRALSAAESGVGKRMVEITACLERPTIGALEASFAEKKTIEAQRNIPAIAELNSAERAVHTQREIVQSESMEVFNAPSEEAKIESDSMNNEERQSTQRREPMREPISDREAALRERYTNPLEAEEFARRLEEKLDVILDRQARPLSSVSINEYSKPVSDIGQSLMAEDIQDRYVRPILIRLSERLKSEARGGAYEAAERLMVEEFAAHCYPGLPLRKGDRAVFIGPAGSGKTSVLGKVAVKTLFKDKIKTKLSTLDDFRVGAQEEIAGYSDALGASMLEEQTQNTDGLSKPQNKDEITLIDCHSNVNDQGQFARLQERIRIAAPSHVFLVVSALTRSADLSRLMRRFSALNPTHLIVTHTDLTDTVGGIYTALKETSLPLVALSNAPGSMGALQAPDPAALARQALGSAWVKGGAV